MSLLIVDAEPYLYTAAAGAEWEVEWSPDEWTYSCDHRKAKDAFTRAIEQIQDLAPKRCKGMFLCFSSKTNFRYAVLRSYKGHRRLQRRPAGYRQLIAWACETWDFWALPEVEGDDAVGVMASYREKDVIASTDKDLMTVPGYHLLEGKVQEITLWEADKAFYCQVLTGDSADGYKGCPGMGAVTAGRLIENLTDERDMWEAVCEAYLKAGLTPEDALVQARCARILRPGEYDLEACKPSLWSPPVA